MDYEIIASNTNIQDWGCDAIPPFYYYVRAMDIYVSSRA